MADLTQRRLALIQWAQSCLTAGDWHGLSDAAMDLLVVDARLEERAGRIESPPRYATADGTPGPVVYQPEPSLPYKCTGCGKMIDWRVDHACPGRQNRDTVVG